MKHIAPESRAVLDCLMQALGSKSYLNLELAEFDDCRYCICKGRDSEDVVLLSLACGHPLSPEAFEEAAQAYGGVAQLCTPKEGYQISLQVSLQSLRSLGDAARLTQLESLSRLRLVALGAPLRNLLASLSRPSDGETRCLTIFSRPDTPFFARLQPGAVTVLYPVWIKNPNNAILTTAFVREFAEARRQSSLGDAPECTMTFAGQTPPVELSPEQQQLLSGFKGGFLSMVILPRHISSASKLDSVTWALLTFYAFIDLHVKGFKASIHTKMRKNADNLLYLVEQAQVPRREKRLIQG